VAKRNYPSGLMPADTVPASPEKKPKGPDNLADRLEAMVGNVRTTPLTQVKAALYLHREQDGQFLSDVLGVREAFDGISRVRAQEETEAE